MLTDMWRFFNVKLIPTLFLFIAVSTGIAMATLNPVDMIQDEATHIARAAGLLHGAILGRHVTLIDPTTHVPYPDVGVMVDSGLVNASLAETHHQLIDTFIVPDNQITLANYKKAASYTWTGHDEVDLDPNTMQDFPAMYLPGAIGLGVGKLIGLSPLNAIIFGRLLMLLSYCCIGYTALRITKAGRSILFCILTLPMSLNLAASFNQDGQIIAFVTLACALLTKDPEQHPKSRLIAGMLLALVICSKPPYGLLLAFYLLPLNRPGFWRRVGEAALLSLPAIGWVTLMSKTQLVPFHPLDPFTPGIWWPDHSHKVQIQSSALNLQILMNPPSRFITLPWTFTTTRAMGMFLEFVGWLGQNSLVLSGGMYLGWLLALIWATIGVILGPSVLRMKAYDRGIAMLLIVLTVWAVELAIYIVWAYLGTPSINGMSGRYLLLIPPFYGVVLAGLGERIKTVFPNYRPEAFETLCTIPAMAMGVFGMIYLPNLIMHHFWVN
jgi:uncharacterized membrane protein